MNVVKVKGSRTGGKKKIFLCTVRKTNSLDLWIMKRDGRNISK